MDTLNIYTPNIFDILAHAKVAVVGVSVTVLSKSSTECKTIGVSQKTSIDSI